MGAIVILAIVGGIVMAIGKAILREQAHRGRTPGKRASAVRQLEKIAEYERQGQQVRSVGCAILVAMGVIALLVLAAVSGRRG